MCPAPAPAQPSPAQPSCGRGQAARASNLRPCLTPPLPPKHGTPLRAGIKARLTPDAAAAYEFHPEEVKAIASEAQYDGLLDQAAKQLVAADLARLAQDADRLAPFFGGAWAGGQE